MSQKEPRVVAELGRPETPDETAARKAASSRAYRGSQTFRNLLTALGVTLVIVAIVIFAVPRGEIPDDPAIDVVSLAADAEAGYGRDIVVADVSSTWRVNSAVVKGDSVPAWTVSYVPQDSSFLVVAQAFDADDAWARTELKGSAPTGTTTINGIVWDEYEIANPSSTGNITYALGTQAGTDHILVYGTADHDTTAAVAASLTTDIQTMQEESAS
ncbi:hypothetical protein FHX49_000383 [Microbacterium endophyticum]|uniref:DUF4245 domain-containing protein n=1 Tax=Microbacterium endophyticum TaxID=1526412 RepID=A0A7W4YM83_9MICO|nr:DUF4245 family protein [Microbacterium endophyticum]MBB2974842.1 hypothetical protein [Microbacterium endophyticum]NIK37139.1 hypothetical protein [Microbacterium endophyticum]